MGREKKRLNTGLFRNEKVTLPEKSKEKNLKKGSIRTKLIVGFMVPCMFIIVLGALAYGLAEKAIISNYENAMENTLKKTAEYYDLLLSNLEIRANQIVLEESVKNYYRGEYANDPLEEQSQFRTLKKQILTIALSDDFVSNIYLLAAYGEEFFSDSMLKPVTYGEYIKTEEGNARMSIGEKVHFSGSHIQLDEMTEKETEKYAFTLTRNMVSKTSKPIGMLVMDIEAEIIKETLANMELTKGGTCAFITPDGREILPFGEGDEQQADVESERATIFADMPELEAFKQSGEQAKTFYQESDGTEYLYLYHTMEHEGFVVCARIPKTEILLQVLTIKHITYVVTIAATILSIIICIWISRRIMKSVKNVSKVLGEVSNGNLNGIVKAERDKEFILLANQLQKMIEKMRVLIQRTEQGAVKVAYAGGAVSQTTEKLVELSRETVQSIDMVNEGVIKQTQDAVECKDIIAELAKRIELVLLKSLSAKELAQTAGVTVNDSIINMENLSVRAGETAQTTQSLIEQMNALSEETKAINTIIETINDISDQTGLLSLNASIEAAREGEVGFQDFAHFSRVFKKLEGISANEYRNTLT